VEILGLERYSSEVGQISVKDEKWVEEEQRGGKTIDILFCTLTL